MTVTQAGAVIDGETVIRQLGQLGRDLEAEVTRYGDIEADAVRVEGTFRVAYARQYLAAAGAVEERKQRAILATDHEWEEMGLAQAAVRLQRESLKALHARIDVGRTMASRDKALAGLAGRDGAT